MTKIQEVRDQIAVQQAYVDGGKEIQCRDKDYHSTDAGWRPVRHPVWNFNRCNYRVKPATIFVNIYGTNHYCSYENEARAIQVFDATAINGRRAVKFCEVMEDK